MITGAHSIIYSANPDADRSFSRDVLQLPYVDVGDGWLIFALPPAEIAVHPAENNNIHALFPMCDDVAAVREQLSGKKVPCAEIEELAWGLLTRINLPGDGSLGLYQPRHARPAPNP